MSSSSELVRTALAEVTPPGYEHVVKGLKKNPDVDNPWAVAWWMKGQGIHPKKAKAKKSKEDDGTPSVEGKIIEALPVTGMAALMRPAQLTGAQLQGSPAPVVPNTSIAFPAQTAASAPPFPIQSFRDDVKRKEGIFASMHPSLGLQPKDVVNYRYSEDPKKACGVCAHYSPDGACEKVIGMIRAVDTCDLWEQKTAQSVAMQALQQRLQQQAAPTQPQATPPAPAGTGVPTVPGKVIATEAGTPEGARKGWETRKGGGGSEPSAPDPDDQPDLSDLAPFIRTKKPLTDEVKGKIVSAVASLDLPAEAYNLVQDMVTDPTFSIPKLQEFMNHMPLLAGKIQPVVSVLMSAEASGG